MVMDEHPSGGVRVTTQLAGECLACGVQAHLEAQGIGQLREDALFRLLARLPRPHLRTWQDSLPEPLSMSGSLVPAGCNWPSLTFATVALSRTEAGAQ